MAINDKKGGTKPKSKSGIIADSSKKQAPKKPRVASVKSKASDAAPPDGVDKARKNRLKRAGVKINKCPITDLPLDVGPRANHWSTPTELNGHVISWLARAILESKISAKELKKVAGLLSEM